MHTPVNRVELFTAMANEIGWGTTPEDVESIAKVVESWGVSFIPTTMIPEDVKNPYSPLPKKET